MSSFKRLVEIAKAEVDALREKVTEKVGGGRRLDGFSDDELSLEIERRRLAKQIKDDEAAKRAADEARGAAAGPSPTEPRPKAAEEPPPASAAGRARGPQIASKAIEQYYANLEVEVGSDLETIKRAYRRLMRKYHPDKHANDPVKYKAATELAQSLTRAYMELKKHLEAQGPG
jgi:DnaJ-domain-containing protein 1